MAQNLGDLKTADRTVYKIFLVCEGDMQRLFTLIDQFFYFVIGVRLHLKHINPQTDVVAKSNKMIAGFV